MASPVGPPESVRHATTPAVLQDEAGTSILPTENLPGVDFGAHLREEKVVEDDTTIVGEQQDTGSYFAGATRQSDVPKPTRNISPDEATYHNPVPALKRGRTAPAHDYRRPTALARSSTLLQNMRRRQPSEAYQYQFDPMSSASDTSSSEDEGMVKERKKRPQAKRVENTASKKEQQEQQQANQDAKKGRSYSKFHIDNDHFRTKGKVSKRDGCLNISMHETANTGYLAKALGQTIKHRIDIPNRRTQGRKHRQHLHDHPEADADALPIASSLHTNVKRPKLNLVIMVIGSRGDIQPFLKIGKILRDEYGHRVRIATHPTFRDFVEKETDLEFFSIGGNPSELMAFMVKNPGLIPGLQTIKEGEIPRRRAAMGEMFEGMWRACINTTDNEKDAQNLKMIGEKEPFIADAIIANPPSMAHVHIAERLGIPLHIMFTFPYSPTQAFPHPLANIRTSKSNVDESYVNFMSYPLVEMMTWQGLGDIVNKFRVKTLGLEPVSSLWAPGALYRMKVPYTYMWSPSLVSKPSDWGPEIDVSGFVFMELAKNFKPEQDLLDFLEAGEPPIYIGFGSIVVDDPNTFTDMIFKATKMAGVRALVNKGWGGLGQSNEDTPDNIFMLGNTPHDWLFPKVKAVVHHGGAGTTAIGLKLAKPTMIVPFFGDQPFWAARVAEAKAGAHEVTPWKRLTAEKLAEGIKQCLAEEAQRNVQKMADGIAAEGDGAANACTSFHRSLPLAGAQNMRCSILDDRTATWALKGSSLRLSPLAAEILLERGKIKPSDLRLFRVYSWNDFDGAGEPITGTAGALIDSFTEIGGGVGMVPIRVAQHMKKRTEHERKKATIQRRKQERKAEKEKSKAVKAGTETATSTQRPANNRAETSNTLGSKMSADPTTPLAMELVRDFEEGIKRSGAALLTMPNDLHVAIAQGFHNAPRLWGDATVRKPVRITGFKTGCKAAGKEFTYGIYDAWTGLVTQPVGGFRDAITVPGKVGGTVHGFGKGVGGFVLKNISAVVSPPAYIGKGAIVYLKKKSEGKGPGSKAYIRRAHFIRGQKDVEALRFSEDPKKNQQLQEMEDEVTEGWKIYEEIWTTAHNQYGDIGGNVVGKVKLHREKKRWEHAGALENKYTAQRALQVRLTGEDMDKHFAKRRKEIAIASAPRAPAMDQPSTYEEHSDVFPNGMKIRTPDPPSNQDNKDGESDDGVAKTPEGDHGENTDVATPTRMITKLHQPQAHHRPK
ncbi:Sterol 3-beta-glucosyltransferase UGT80B1 [Fulvia fulva]|uniref:Sterol 3-beta-glucosyltransferase UGT80B1 n=1 Tax=Passalora fulva TaxID=5499 RepID=A0A9Q8LEG8_PASFU|nr:Sterol 3-beta-glucosyltransferase UGT80B1 [Fulvia fulva]KAK4626159.1 Sterol 3-beta-glucosyltransferase UGT80B1 [Fulvia fulva]KAK4627587.1 Sterol 3-beta-glucosyltransferase UGT80B1 [Fulvia fulva]UJO15897.1 Sterol 3-beta-glucosyltransferase UGT80B1 [Fulvia fulva]WPV13375.1 Sterol 3-beta-glucosyltransferase UGT80B1 [Fulvia fulva]WPV28898.1 Sterol 3-beta-glucosyltransferase UGT80B1 [Fulvia fulva]